MTIVDADTQGLLVKPDVARAQLDRETKPPTPPGEEAVTEIDGPKPPDGLPVAVVLPKRFRGTVTLDPERVGRDAAVVADEVIAHLNGLVGAEVKVTLEI